MTLFAEGIDFPLVESILAIVIFVFGGATTKLVSYVVSRITDKPKQQLALVSAGHKHEREMVDNLFTHYNEFIAHMQATQAQLRAEVNELHKSHLSCAEENAALKLRLALVEHDVTVIKKNGNGH